eukprot:8640881-Alexandrium_andersonii.AAC.1
MNWKTIGECELVERARASAEIPLGTLPCPEPDWTGTNTQAGIRPFQRGPRQELNQNLGRPMRPAS